MTSMIAFHRRAMRAVSLAVATVGLLAACDTDSPLEPQARTVNVPAPQANIQAASGSFAWNVVQAGGGVKIFLAGAKFQITGGGAVRTVVDNDRSDSDGAVGKLKLVGLKPGPYTVCETLAPSGYAIPSPACHQVTVSVNKTTWDEFAQPQLPVMMVEFQDLQANLVGGGAVSIRAGGPTGTLLKTVIDNGAGDLNATAGKFRVQLAAAGTYSLCVAYLPAGYQFATSYTVCQTATLTLGMGIGLNPYTLKPIGG